MSRSQGNTDFFFRNRKTEVPRNHKSYPTSHTNMWKNEAKKHIHLTWKPWAVLFPSISLKVLVSDRAHVITQDNYLLFAQDPSPHALYLRFFLRKRRSSVCGNHVVWMIEVKEYNLIHLITVVASEMSKSWWKNMGFPWTQRQVQVETSRVKSKNLDTKYREQSPFSSWMCKPKHVALIIAGSRNASMRDISLRLKQTHDKRQSWDNQKNLSQSLILNHVWNLTWLQGLQWKDQQFSFIV